MSTPAGTKPPDTIPQTGGYAGFGGFDTEGSALTAIDFLVRQIIAGKTFGALVEVMSVADGRVSVKPAVDQVDGQGNQVPHGTIYGIPYAQLQAGTNGIILTPVPGEIGIAVLCDRDISNVKKTGAAAGPGSFRQNSWADGVYVMRVFGPAPTNFINLDGDNINITSPGMFDVTAPNINLTGTVNVIGVLKVNGTIVTVP
jgi:hypothetical protein